VIEEVSAHSEVKGRKDFAQEYRIVTKDVKVKWIDDRTWIRKNEEREITHYQGIVLDITKRKMIEEALRTSEAQLSNAMKIAHLGHWEYDVASDRFIFNDNFYDIFRTTAKQVGGYRMSLARYAKLFLHPDDQQMVVNEVKAALETTDPYYNRQLEHRIIYADGEVGYISVRYFIVRDDHGRTIKAYGANQDITEHKRVEMALKEEKEKAERYLDTAGVILVALNTQGQVTLMNKKGRQVLGYDSSEIIGKNWFDHFLIEELRDEIKEVFKKLLSGEIEAAEYYENSILTKQGQERVIAWHNTTLRNDQGNIIGIFSSGEDITERCQAENALRRAKKEWESTFDAMSDWMVLIDEKGDILRSNRAGEEYTGLAVKDIIGKNCCLLVHGKDKYIDQCPLRLAMRSGEKGQLELQVPHSDRWLMVTVDPLKDEAGTVQGAVHIIRDITVRKQAEQAIKDSLREKELLLREIHHRVKNNLQVISSLINFQARCIEDKLSIDSLRELQSRIRSMSLIHEKLYQSKDLAYVDFKQYLEGLTSELYRTYGVTKDRIRLEIDVEDFAPSIELAIPCGLIINELTSNALKHAFPGDRKGRIVISVKKADKKTIQLTVGDNGTSLPPELNFRKTDSLGLQLVTLLAEDQLNGRIELEQDEGTIFRIRLNG
jgi:PAS domain S-box-containing protein